MKKALLILALLIGTLGYGQSKQAYLRLGKLTTTEINAIDVSNTTVVYTAYDTTLGIEVINTGSGWVPRITASGISDGDKGDITVSSSGAVWSIDANAVLTSHIANLQITSGKLATASVGGNALIDNSVQPIDIKSSNANTYGHALVSLNGTDFTWVDPSTFGTGVTAYQDLTGEPFSGLISGLLYAPNNLFFNGISIKNKTQDLASATTSISFQSVENAADLGNYYGNIGLSRPDTSGSDRITNHPGSYSLLGDLNKVKIGSATSGIVPTEKLYIEGNVNVTGVYKINGVDVSTEWNKDTYYGILSGSTSNTTYDINVATSREIDMHFLAATVALDFTNEASAVGEPILMRLTSLNAGGTVFTFNSAISDINNNTGFTVTLVENEEITLHFVVHDSTYTWCTNYPIGGGSMTGAEIKAAYEGEADTNAFTDAYVSSVDGSEQVSRKKTDLSAPNDTDYLTTSGIATALYNSELLATEAMTATRVALLTDADGILEVTSGSDVVYTIPQNSSVAFPVGTLLMLRRNGAGNITIAYSGTASGDSASTYKYGETISLRKTGTDTWVILNPPRPDYETYIVNCSAIGVDATTGTAKGYFRMPHSMTLTNVRATAFVAGTTTGLTVDINENGTSVLSTKLTVNVGAKTSVGASVSYVISDTSLGNDSEMTIDFDTVPTGMQRIQVQLTGYR